MRARLNTPFGGQPGMEVGEIVQGPVAVRLIAAGFADRIADEERATIPLSAVKAPKPAAKKPAKAKAE